MWFRIRRSTETDAPASCKRGLDAAGALVGLQYPMRIDANEYVDHSRRLELCEAVRRVGRNYDDVPGSHRLAYAARDRLANSAGTDQAAHYRIISWQRGGVIDRTTHRQNTATLDDMVHLGNRFVYDCLRRSTPVYL
jgi:hypothetical protein